jgi:hypothetical protein
MKKWPYTRSGLLEGDNLEVFYYLRASEIRSDHEIPISDQDAVKKIIK